MTLTKSKFAWLTLLLVGCLVGGGFLLASITSGDDDVDTSADLRGVDVPDKGPSLETRGVLREAGDEGLRPADSGAAPTPAGATPPAASGITWRGVVKDPEGNPLPGVDVLVMPGASAGLRGAMRDVARFGRTKTDRKGAFTLVQGAVENPRIVAWSDDRLPASKLLEGLDPANTISLVMPGPRVIRARVTWEGHEGFLPLGVIFRTTEELFDYAHDPAKQQVWVQSAEATEGEEATLSKWLNTTAPIEVTYEAERGFTTIPLRYVLEGDQTDCHFRVVPSATIKFKLIDDATGEPLADGVRTTLFMRAEGSSAIVASSSTANPSFEVTTGVPPGTYYYDFKATAMRRSKAS